jgi:two-component system chemotaxis sensor kinase CheA
VQDQIYIVPLAQIAESLQPSEGQIKTVNGREVVDIRNEYLPVVSLANFLGVARNDEDAARDVLVILETERGRAAIRVAELVGQQQVVLKSLEANYRKVHGISGATIMGDGRVAFILDVSALVGSAEASQYPAAAAGSGA